MVTRFHGRLNRVAVAAFLFGTLCFLPQGRVLAQRTEASPSAEEQQARQIFEQAAALADEARWAEAAALFRLSLETFPKGTTAFRYAEALLHDDHPSDAHRLVVQLRAEEFGALPPAALARVRQLEVEVQSRLGRLAVWTDGAAGAALEVDGEAHPLVEGRVTLWLEAGTHQVVVHQGDNVYRQQITLEAASEEVLRMEGLARVQPHVQDAGPEENAPPIEPSDVAVEDAVVSSVLTEEPPPLLEGSSRRALRIGIAVAVLAAVGGGVLATWLTLRDDGREEDPVWGSATALVSF